MTDKQIKLASRIWLAALIESAGDCFIDEQGIHDVIDIKVANRIHFHSREWAKKMRGKHPVITSMAEIVKYVKTL